MSLPALLDLFQRHRAKATGVWKLGDEPSRTVFLDQGDIVFAQSNFPQDRLTSILVERGLLTQDQLDYAMANLKPGISVGKNLIDMGFITQRVLLDVARLQVERVVWSSLATADLPPQFTEKDLEPNVVRLPFETPLLLLNGLLGLQDREALLDLLGALNQVVVLESRRVQELSLPADLAKLAPMLDGTRTLLELARESGVEPIRLGAFALFLREMGWARLHELPPLDRSAVDQALSPDPEPVSPELPDPGLDSAPSLFESIAAASKPTTNLEHLSQALDELPEVEEALPAMAPLPEPAEPEPEGVTADEGQALLETPREELPLPLDAEPTPPEVPAFEPRIQLPVDEPEASDSTEAPPPEAAEAAPAKRSPLVAVLLLAVLAGGGWGAWRWMHRRPKPSQEWMVNPAPVQPPAAPPKAEPAPVAPPAETPKAEEPAPAKAPEPPAKAPEAPPADSKASRLLNLRQGNLAQALAQGEALAKAEPKAWTLRLLIACKEDTLKGVPDLFPGEGPDLFVLPITMRAGQACTQVFHGRYATAKEAEEGISKLPASFQAKGNRPKVFLIGDIPRGQ